MVAVAIPYPFPVLFGEYSSFFREVLEYFPGRIGVLSEGDWGNFRTPVPVFPQEWPGTCGNNRKKVYDLHCWLIHDYLFCPKNSWKKVVKMFGSYVLQHYFCTRFREGKWHGRLATATVREGKRKKLPKKFGGSEKLLTFAVTFREGATGEEIFERIFIPTKVVQVSRPDGCPDRVSRQLKTGTKRQ